MKTKGIKNRYNGVKIEVKDILEKLIENNAVAPSEKFMAGFRISPRTTNRRYGAYLSAFHGLLESNVIEKENDPHITYPRYRIKNLELAKELLNYPSSFKYL